MNRVFTCASYLVGVMVLSACSTIETPQQTQEGGASAQDPTRVQFDRPLHFSAPDGSDVVVQAGTYRVEQATGPQIRLVPSGDGLPTLLSAEAVPTDLDMAAPFALALPFEPDAYDLVLLVPGGPALETRGSVSGVLPRGGSSLFKAITGPPLALEVPPQQPGPDLYPRGLMNSGCHIHCLGCSYHRDVSVIVTNGGTVAAGPSRTRVQGRYNSSTQTTIALMPGQSAALSFRDSCSVNATGGNGQVPCRISVGVDAENEVAESSETNNVQFMACTP